VVRRTALVQKELQAAWPVRRLGTGWLHCACRAAQAQGAGVTAAISTSKYGRSDGLAHWA
jgi:hypothetical protein